MEIEKRDSQRFRPKGTQELLAQALNGRSPNEQVTTNRQKLQALAKEAINTEKWEEVDRVIEKLSDDYEKVKSERLKIGFIKWQINRLKKQSLQILYPTFNITWVRDRLEKLSSILQNLESASNPTSPKEVTLNPKPIDLVQLTETIATIKSLLTELPNNDLVLNQIEQEVVKLVQLLAQISEQMDKIKEAKDFLIEELANKGLVRPLLEQLEKLKREVESKLSSLEIELSTVSEFIQDKNANNLESQRQQQIQQKIKKLESEIKNLEDIKIRITNLEEKIQPNQNANISNDPILEVLTRKLKELNQLEMETRNIIRLVFNDLCEINTLASKSLGSIETQTWQDYIDAIRWWRNHHEQDIRSAFGQFLEQNPLDPDLEKTRLEQLRRLIINPDNPEELDRFRQVFPGGSFLYHGTKVRQAIQILFSGALKSTKTLQEESTNKKQIPHNSGHEGTSWSLNEIDALPGDSYHLVGFLAAPEEILGPNQQLTIPSRAAPFEVIQISDNIDPNEFYDYKIQYEIYFHVSMGGENNSVISNLVHADLEKTRQSSKDYPIPMLIQFINKYSDDRELAEYLRTFYQIRTKDGQLKNYQEIEYFDSSDTTVKLSEELFQQSEIPVAAVWIQALIDTGRINNDPDFAGITSVRKVVEKLPGKPRALREEFMKEIGYLDPLWQEQESKITPIRVPISKLYLVVPKHDLERYLRVLARCDNLPKGIIVYDHREIRLENFASLHRGDHAVLTKWLQELIPPKTPEEGYIDYCQTFLGKPEISLKERAGHARHIIQDSCIPRRPRIVRDGNGLAVEY